MHRCMEVKKYRSVDVYMYIVQCCNFKLKFTEYSTVQIKKKRPNILKILGPQKYHFKL